LASRRCRNRWCGHDGSTTHHLQRSRRMKRTATAKLTKRRTEPRDTQHRTRFAHAVRALLLIAKLPERERDAVLRALRFREIRQVVRRADTFLKSDRAAEVEKDLETLVSICFEFPEE